MDFYLIPGTPTLRNTLDITDPHELAAAEAAYVAARLIELYDLPVAGRYDHQHLKAFHQRIFQDVYEWAGEFRSTYLAKRDSVNGYLSHFTVPEKLEHSAADACRRFPAPTECATLDRAAFARVLADGYADLIELHPFRDGNGRATRAFLSQYAKDSGYEISFDFIGRERWTRASIEAHQGDRAPIRRVFLEATDPIAVTRFRTIAPLLSEKTREGIFNLDEQYVSVPEPGRQISGLVALVKDDVALVIADDRLELTSVGAFEHPPIIGEEATYREPEERKAVHVGDGIMLTSPDHEKRWGEAGSRDAYLCELRDSPLRMAWRIEATASGVLLRGADGEVHDAGDRIIVRAEEGIAARAAVELAQRKGWHRIDLDGQAKTLLRAAAIEAHEHHLVVRVHGELVTQDVISAYYDTQEQEMQQEPKR